MNSWSMKDDWQLRKLVESGETDQSIAEMMGRSRASVKHRRHILALFKEPQRKEALVGVLVGPNARRARPWTDDEDRALIMLVENGRADAEIANVLSRTLSGVRERRKRLKIQRERPSVKAWTTEIARHAQQVGEAKAAAAHFAALLRRPPARVDNPDEIRFACAAHLYDLKAAGHSPRSLMAQAPRPVKEAAE